MKYVIALSLLLGSYKSLAQVQGFGLNLGLTNYTTDTNMLVSKPDNGFTLGIIRTFRFSDHVGLFMEINYNQHHLKFAGRKTASSTPEDIKFKLDEVSVPLILNLEYIKTDDFSFGINLGPSFHFTHNFTVRDESKEYYLLDPLSTPIKDLQFDTKYNKLSLNTFLAMGLNVKYNDKIMTSFRYYTSVTDPYREVQKFSSNKNITGKDSYYTFTLTYLIYQ